MIYVLFGPPCVGKSYLGNLLYQYTGYYFYDADNLIDKSEQEAIKDGHYDQKKRDYFVNKLKTKVEELYKKHKIIIIAEAFTKEKNRLEFINNYKGNIKFIRVLADYKIAKIRNWKRIKLHNHVINEKSFEQFWKEFEEPNIPHLSIDNKKDLKIDTLLELLK